MDGGVGGGWMPTKFKRKVVIACEISVGVVVVSCIKSTNNK